MYYVNSDRLILAKHSRGEAVRNSWHMSDIRHKSENNLDLWQTLHAPIYLFVFTNFYTEVLNFTGMAPILIKWPGSLAIFLGFLEASYEIWCQFTQQFQRISCLNVLADNEDAGPSTILLAPIRVFGSVHTVSSESPQDLPSPFGFHSTVEVLLGFARAECVISCLTLWTGHQTLLYIHVIEVTKKGVYGGLGRR